MQFLRPSLASFTFVSFSLTLFPSSFPVVPVYAAQNETASRAQNVAAQAQQASERGDWEAAISLWTRAAQEYHRHKPVDEARARAQVGLAFAELGQLENAAQMLGKALTLANGAGDVRVALAIHEHLGAVYGGLRDNALAERHLQAALTTARATGDNAAIASVLNNLGNLRAAEDNAAKATEAYLAAVELAKKSGSAALVARVQLNLSSLHGRSDASGDAPGYLAAASEAIPALSDNYEKFQLLTTLGAGYLAQWNREDEKKASHLQLAAQTYEAARGLATKLGNNRSLSLALGWLGEIYEKQGELQTALRVTRQARFFAQQTQSPHLLYRWEWQMGRLLSSGGEADEAIAAYRRAIVTFRTLCDCSTGSAALTNYEDTVRPLYYQLADLLLRRSSGEKQPAAEQAYLREARDTIELLKTAELSDYFQDACVAGGMAKTKNIETILTDAAVVYYIPLPDRTEIIVGLPSGLQRVTVPMGNTALMARARRMRLQLQRPASQQYLNYSKELYDLLIRPLESSLQSNKIKTLVCVLDGALRTIPMGVLHDGEKFLIEKYSLAVAPSMSLTDPQPLERSAVRVLAGGVSESVQGYDALKNVPRELDSIKSSYASTSLLDKQFLKARMQDQFTTG
ncbi:MAG TPA: CHAT domain-containing protein, partial [Abditibacteriaceae bacterium]